MLHLQLSRNGALFCGQFALSLMQTIFMFYYVKVFLNIYHISEYWFNLAQILYMFWNAVNDPLFGYLQDFGRPWMRNRNWMFLLFGPFLVLSFVSLWFPWGVDPNNSMPQGLHLICSLFLYDAFYSCLSVAWGAMFAETSKDHKKRVQAMKYSQLAILLSVSSIGITEKLSKNLVSFHIFQYITVLIAILASIFLYFTGKSRNTSMTKYKLEGEDSLCPEKEPEMGFKQMFTLTRQIFGSSNFRAIALTSFLHTCRSVAHLNFASIALDLLIPKTIFPNGSWKRSFFMTLSALGPQIIIIVSEKLIVRFGTSRSMIFSFKISILSSLLYFFRTSPTMILTFMLIDSVTVHSFAPLFNILLSEFIAEDANNHSRSKYLSSFVFSINSFIIKPAQSLAPILIVTYLNGSGYQDYLKKTIAPSSIHFTEISQSMANILFIIPLVVGTIQYLVFRKYQVQVQSVASENFLLKV
uniref:Transmembrane protein 180-like n=1 Tax=Rhabditophanes sp. KR3021 TaxID=114890 RepID=A0AC35U0D1_9BILA